ncbi:MAG TPA: hypothetical protein VEK57_18895 [Thermoanaerobaculia bacterium]|nr:hypothetical protein [Thermoanaerobaculia bacterium]
MRTASLLLTLLVSTAAMAGEIFIPVTYRGAGAADSVWRTEISVSNISSSVHATPIQTTIALHRENVDPVTIRMPLSPMEVLTIPDALWAWFGVENGGGIVRVTWAENDARITARARIYNLGSEAGEFGQGVPGVRVDNLVSDQFLVGLSGVDGNRTNVGVSNPHDQHVLFWITLYDTSGLARGAFATSVAPRSFRQFNDIFSYFQSGPLNAAAVRITGTDATLYAYASIVRNDTGDATFVTPAP